METKIRIIGTSKGVILSKDTLNTLEANLGDYIEINLDGNSVILTKSSKKDIKIRNEVKNQDLLSTFIGEFFKNDIYREHYINK
ncbi:AbrB/MazE/SpoVT family DNA-binding domain-containing protein, partial [Vibrio harveyi]